MFYYLQAQISSYWAYQFLARQMQRHFVVSILFLQYKIRHTPFIHPSIHSLSIWFLVRILYVYSISLIKPLRLSFLLHVTMFVLSNLIFAIPRFFCRGFPLQSCFPVLRQGKIVCHLISSAAVIHNNGPETTTFI